MYQKDTCDGNVYDNEECVKYSSYHEVADYIRMSKSEAFHKYGGEHECKLRVMLQDLHKPVIGISLTHTSLCSTIDISLPIYYLAITVILEDLHFVEITTEG